MASLQLPASTAGGAGEQAGTAGEPVRELHAAPAPPPRRPRRVPATAHARAAAPVLCVMGGDAIPASIAWPLGSSKWGPLPRGAPAALMGVFLALVPCRVSHRRAMPKKRPAKRPVKGKLDDSSSDDDDGGLMAGLDDLPDAPPAGTATEVSPWILALFGCLQACKRADVSNACPPHRAAGRLARHAI